MIPSFMLFRFPEFDEDTFFFSSSFGAGVGTKPTLLGHFNCMSSGSFDK